jgi:hypothetical protein
MAPIVESIEISRRPEDVFPYITDPSRLPELQESVVNVQREDSAPIAVGSRVVVTRRSAPRTAGWERSSGARCSPAPPRPG